MDKKTILVCGATGNQGGSVVEALVNETDFQVRALTRKSLADVDVIQLGLLGCQVVRGDLTNADSLRAALEGCFGVFLVINPWEADLKTIIQQTRNAVDTMRTCNISHLVWSTIPKHGDGTDVCASPSLAAMAQITEYIAESPHGAPSYTFVQPAWLMENMMDEFFLDRGNDETWLLRMNGGDEKISLAALEDVGKVVARIFENPSKYAGETVPVLSDSLTVTEMAQIIQKEYLVECDMCPRHAISAAKYGQKRHDMAHLLKLYPTNRLSDHSKFLATEILPDPVKMHLWLRSDPFQAKQRIRSIHFKQRLEFFSTSPIKVSFRGPTPFPTEAPDQLNL